MLFTALNTVGAVLIGKIKSWQMAIFSIFDVSKFNGKNNLANVIVTCPEFFFSGLDLENIWQMVICQITFPWYMFIITS